MNARIYISFLLLSCLWTYNLKAQEVLFQLGADGSESWDAINCTQDESCFFGMGFRRSTEVNGEQFSAIGRDVLLGSIKNGTPSIWGQLASASNTQVSYIQESEEGIFVAGNAFSYLIYKSDTLFIDEGTNKAFMLKLDRNGELISLRTLDATASALCIDGWCNESIVAALFEITDIVHIEGQQYIPKAETASLVVVWDHNLLLDTAFLLDGLGTIRAVKLEGEATSIYIAGNFKGSIEFGGDSVFTRTADDDVFLAKWDANAHRPEYLKHISGVYQDKLRSLFVEQERVLLGGQFIGAIEFDDLQIITGLSVAGFIGAYHSNGEALWLRGLYGNSDLLSVEHIETRGVEIFFSALTGEQIIYGFDTLSISWQLGEIHSVLGRMETDGDLLEWVALEGNPIALVSSLSTNGENIKIALEMTGEFNGYNSKGGYDLLWLEDGFSSVSNLIVKPLTTYPNPATDLLYIGSELSGANFSIFNISGHELHSGRLSGTQLNIEFLPAGNYFLVVDADVRYVGQFVKF